MSKLIELEKMGVIEKLEHPSVQKEIQILEFLEGQGVTIDDSSELNVSRASNDKVSVGVVAGPKTGSIGHAFVRLLTTPKIGHEALTVILEPNLPVKPSSLMLPTRKIQSMRQASLFYSPVQSGAAKAITTYLEAGGEERRKKQNVILLSTNTVVGDEILDEIRSQENVFSARRIEL